MAGGGGGDHPPAECVINVSEGRDAAVVSTIAEAGRPSLLDVHSDAEHHRSVLTLAGPLDEVEASARRVAVAAVTSIDLRTHRGVHPRLGALDVVPFVPLGDDPSGDARDAVLRARDDFAHWVGAELGVPCFLYGPERTLPDIRRGAFRTLTPDAGPPAPHPTAGASAVGARPVLIAYNLWITDASPGGTEGRVVDVAKQLAATLRRPGLRTLGLAVAGGAQVSCNVTDPSSVHLVDVYDEVDRGAQLQGCRVQRGELVGLLPEAALLAVPEHRRAELGLRTEDTIEFRLGTRHR